MVSSVDAKDIFYMSLMELVSKKSLEKISVKEIVDNTNLSRQTFYRCYKDKYDLINWSMKVLLDQLSVEVRTDKSTRKQVLVKLLSIIKKHRGFFASAFKMNGQNAMVDFFHKYSVAKGILNCNVQTEDKKQLYEINFAYSFFSYGVVHSIIDWTLTGMKESPEYLADLIIDCMPVKIKELIL